MAADRQQLGRLGEEAAARHLSGRGLTVVARNFRTPLGELDLIARSGDLIVFVEVKTRRAAGWYGGANEAVDRRKALRVRRLAEVYLGQHGLTQHPCRFDVVAVTVGPSGPEIEWIQDAF